MTNKSKSYYSVFLLLVTFWTSGSILIDFLIVPSVFTTIDDFFNAGELAIRLFSKFNKVELVLALFLTAFFSYKLYLKKNVLIPLIASILCLIIVVVYVSYLTPKISDLTELWKKADALNLAGISGIPDVQQEHQKFHRIYVILDAIKLFILLTVVSIGIYREEKWQ